MRDPLGQPADRINSVSRALRIIEAVGGSPDGLSVKQIARRCEVTVATAYHLVRTLTYEGYLRRRDNDTYMIGLEIADRFRKLRADLAEPAAAYAQLRGLASCRISPRWWPAQICW